MRFLLFVLGGLLVACGSQNTPTTDISSGAQPENAAAAGAEGRHGEVVPGQFIVVFDDRVRILADRAERDGDELPLSAFLDSLLPAGREALLIGPLTSINALVLRGDSLSPGLLESLPSVAYAEADRFVTVQPPASTRASQDNAPWGLDRIDQRSLPLDGRFVTARDGAGANVYIIDTGIRASHEEFAGRIDGGRNFAGSGGGLPLPLIGLDLGGLLGGLLGGGAVDPEDFSDCNGHGTHVAGTAAGTTFGVAKQARLYAVRVFDCSGAGATSTVIAGVDWVTNNRQLPAVANLSLGGGNSQAMDDAARAAIDRGVTMVVAAGNNNSDACVGSPNRVAEAITVGSTTRSDTRSGFSNWGDCVDLLAPGSDIVSAWLSSDTATQTLSGTSMAAPHVTGAVAIAMQNGAETPSETIKVIQQATQNQLSNLRGSPNRLLFVE